MKKSNQPAATEPSPARTRAPRAADGGGSGTAAEGAQPSNRAPSNSIPEKITPLLFGVDSLYLSFPGDLSEAWERQLEHLKLLAQSESEKEQALAQLKVGEHLFEVSDHGAKCFPYILADNCYLHSAKQFHHENGRDLEAYISRKVALKARRYNTLDNTMGGNYGDA